MSEAQPQAQPDEDRVTLPPRMQAQLARYQKRVWAIKLAEGALAAIFGLVISYLVVFGLDRLFDTPAALRLVILAAGSVGMVIVFPLKYHNWVWSQRRLDQVARLLRHRFPRFGDHLLGIVELAQAESQKGTSRALVRAAMRQVDAELEKRNLDHAVPHPRHRRWAWAAGVPLAVISILMFVIPAAGGNAFARWSMPWRDVERYTFAQLEGETELHVVPYAEPFRVEVILKEDSPWRPETGSATYNGQPPVVAALEEATYRFNMPPQTSDGSVSIQVGDARRAVGVEPKMRPALTDVVARAQLPAYLERTEPVTEGVRGGTVSLVKGSQAVFEATATRELAHATFDGRPQTVDGPRVRTESITVEASTEHELAWRDRFGLEAREPQVLRIDALDDVAPTVVLAKLKAGKVILSSEVLTFEIQAGDDFGVKRVGIEWEGIEDPVHNPEPSMGEKTVAAGAPTRDTLTVPATFSAEREKVRAQSLRLRAFVEDYLPARAREYSPYLVLHMLTTTEHFKWLTEQISLWINAAQEVRDRELQLAEINQELSELPPEALDDPAQRKKIQSQAAAEKANAARLDALVQMGTQLVQEATKNEEFDADQLESWAKILELLKEIASEKMPSVAELLAQAAEAPGQATEPQAEPPLPGDAAEDPGKPGEASGEPHGQDAPAPPGGKHDGKPQAAKYGVDSQKPPESLDESPNDPNEPGESVNVDRSEQAEGEPKYLPANPTPHVGDTESGFNKSEKAEDAPQIKGGLLLPGTSLKGSGRDPEEEDAEEPEATTGELVLEAVAEQRELLEAFAALADEINKLLLSFENSTFVKRLKAASREQMDLAVDLNDLDGFGLEKRAVVDRSGRKSLADREDSESQTLLTIQEDMAAYADRRPSENYSRVIDEMQTAAVVDQIGNICAAIRENRVGMSTIEAEYWADALDRWAEQLVDPMGPSSPIPLELIELPNLSPRIIVEVMRIIDREIQLREETRELHQAREAIEKVAYEARGAELGVTQAELAAKSRELAEEVRAMPGAPDHADDTLAEEIETLKAEGKLDEEALGERIEWLRKRTELGKEVLGAQIAKLTNAATVMDEVTGMLAKPTTGPTTIAAVSEVIEILLETHRLPNAPMVVKAPPTSAPALSLIGRGDDGGKAFIEDRAPGQATGRSGRELPEEYRQGLDAYFNAIEER